MSFLSHGRRNRALVACGALLLTAGLLIAWHVGAVRHREPATVIPSSGASAKNTSVAPATGSPTTDDPGSGMDSFMSKLREESAKGLTDKEREVRSRNYLTKEAEIERRVNAVVEGRNGQVASLGAEIRESGKNKKAIIRAALLKRLNTDENEDIRYACLNNLGYFPEGRGALLAQVLRTDKSEKVRNLAIRSLGQFGSEEELDALREVARENSGLTCDAIRSIGHIGGPRATDMLLDIWKNSNGNRDTIVLSLGAAGDPRALYELGKILAGEDESVRSPATVGVWLLAQRNRETFPVFTSAVTVLRDCLHDGNPDVRRSAIYALGDLGDANDLERIRALLTDGYSRKITVTENGQELTRDHFPVRAAAAETIGKMENRLFTTP